MKQLKILYIKILTQNSHQKTFVYLCLCSCHNHQLLDHSHRAKHFKTCLMAIKVAQLNLILKLKNVFYHKLYDW